MCTSSSSVTTSCQLETNDTELAVIDGVVQFRENAGPRPSILSVHGTAISHASSTPMVGHQQNQMQELMDTNLSSIFLTPRPPRRHSRSSIRSLQDRKAEVVSSSTTDRSSVHKSFSDFSDDDSDEPPRKREKKNPGTVKDWDVFKPKNMDSLYYLVVNQPNNLDEHCWNWVQLYRRDQEEGVHRLLQFFVDVCGFENIDISANYRMDFNFDNVKFSITRNNSMVHKVNSKYLFKFKTGWAMEKQSFVYDFIEKLMVIQCRTLIFFNFQFLKHYLYLFGSLYGTNLKSTITTCGYLILKMVTVGLKFRVTLHRDIENLNRNTEERNILRRKANVVFNFIDFLLTILINLTTKTDSSLREMFSAVMDEIKIWLKMDVPITFHDLNHYFAMIYQVIYDKTARVRKAAITTCREFLNLKGLKDLEEVLSKSTLERFLEMIGDRVCDINDEVAVIAINVHTEIFEQRLSMAIPIASKAKLTMLLCDNIYSVAFAAGRCLSAYMSLSGDKTFSTLSIIRFLIQIFRDIKNKNIMSLLVESFMPHVPELKDWDFIINLLLRDGALVYDEELMVVEMLTESIKQVIIGKGPRTSIAKIDSGEVCKVLDIFLRGFPALQRKYGANSDCLRQFYGVLAEIDFTDVTLNRFREHMNDVLVDSYRIFFKSSDEVLLKNMSRYFFLLTDHLSPSYDRSLGCIHNIIDFVVEKTINRLKNIDESEIINEDDKFSIEDYFLKLQMLYYYHDLSDLIDVSFMLDKAVKLEENITTKTRIYIFHCCLLHLCHKFKKVLIENENSEQLNNLLMELKVKLDEYIESCFVVVSSTQILSLKYKVFENLCDLYLNINQPIYSLLAEKPHLSVLILEPIQTPVFMIVAQEYFFESEDNLTLNQRRKTFFNVLDMVFCNGFPLLECAKLYKYFHSHYEDYGTLIQSHIMHLKEDNLISALMILHTIKYCYVHLPAEDSTASRNLMQLSCRFQTFLYSYPKVTLTTLRLAIKFITPHVDRYPMINFIKPLLSLLSYKDRKKTANYMLSCIPQEHQFNEHVVDCITFLRAKKCNLNVSFATVIGINCTDSGSTSSDAYRIENFSDDDSLEVNIGGTEHQ